MSVEYVIRCDESGCDTVIDSHSDGEAAARKRINAQGIGLCLTWGDGDYCPDHKPHEPEREP